MNKLSLKNFMKKKKKKGFTLVELIIVIAIIAILVAIAIPKFGQITKNAKVKADIATAKTIHGLAAAYIAEGNDIIKDSDIAPKLDGGTSTDKDLPNTKLNSSAKFHVELDENGNIHVYSMTTTGTGSTATTKNGAEIYPNSSSYGN